MSKKITIGALVIITVLFALLVSQTSVLANETKTIEPASDKRAFELVDTFLRRVATSAVEKVE